MGASAKQRHIDIMVAQILSGDSAGALRHYISNRVSFATFQEAKRKAATIEKRAKENGGFLYPSKLRSAEQ